MCLEFHPEDNNIKDLFGKRQVIICYKILEEDREIPYGEETPNSTGLVTPWQYKRVRTEKGFFKSNRRTKNLTRNERLCCAIHKGIHVFLQKSAAGRNQDSVKVFRVKCYRKDFVAYDKDFEEAVFTQIKLLPETIKKYKTEKKV